ncbi:MAG: DUF4386 family protein [Anaerolineae bacterium]|nr:DUF4386 family protein [Anaerolineae bacterium]
MTSRSGLRETKAPVRTGDVRWKRLYRIGAVAVLVTVAFYLTELVVLSLGGRSFPSTINDWFALFAESRLLGLLYLNALDMLSIALMGPMFLALYMALRQADEAWMTVGLFFGLIGIPIFIAPRSITLNVLTLSDRFAAATTDVQRTQIMTVGESVALGSPTTQTVGFLFIATAVFIISLVLLRSTIFGKVTAYVGLLASSITFIGFITMLVAPSIAGVFVVLSMLPWLVWWLLIARGLWQLGRVDG